MYVFCICKNSAFFTFQIFALVRMPSSILFSQLYEFQDESFHGHKGTQMNLYHKFNQY